MEYIGDSAFNQTVALTLYIEREQGDIPSGRSDNRDSTAASVMGRKFGFGSGLKYKKTRDGISLVFIFMFYFKFT